MSVDPIKLIIWKFIYEILGKMIELNSADKLCFGKDENCVEYVFEMPPIFPLNNQSTKKLCGIPNCSTTNSPEKFRQQTPFNYYHVEKSIKDEEPIFLPIVGVSFYLVFFLLIILE